MKSELYETLAASFCIMFFAFLLFSNIKTNFAGIGKNIVEKFRIVFKCKSNLFRRNNILLNY